LAYGEYAVMKFSTFEWLSIGSWSKGEQLWKITQEVGSQKYRGQMQMWTEYEPWCIQIED
jgi:hypothetical protein